MTDHVPQPCEPLPIVLTGDEEWAERTPGVSLKEYREWLKNAGGKVTVITLNPYTKAIEIEEREPLKEKKMSTQFITNCPNCGAPIDISRSSCEYCGTPYEKSKPDPYIEDFTEVLSRISRDIGFNLRDSTTLYANNQPVYSQVRESIQATQQKLLSSIASAGIEYCAAEERKMIEDMRNVAAPMIFPKVAEQVNLIDKIRYERKKELLHDILSVLILLGPCIITCIIIWFSTH